jgi:hypothetical protein
MQIKELASKAGVTPDTVTAFEVGKKTHAATPKVLEMALRAGGVNFESGDNWEGVTWVVE